ncbi:MAG: tetratricopeptide repeat protein [Deltaproteobacteria bacterium]|nr:tetratricopeptide repeat protein [Deltaproteobacteria bacterium]
MSNAKKNIILFYAGSLLFGLIAQKTKEISFTLPFIIALYEFAFLRDAASVRKKLLYLLPFAMLLAVIPFAIFSPEFGLSHTEKGVSDFIRTSQVKELATLSRWQYLVTQLSVIMTYLRLLFFPVNQNLDYDYPIYSSLFEPRVLFSLVFLGTLLASSIYLFARSWKKKNGAGLLVSFGVLWFFITLSVESSVIPIQDVIFEHRVYLPSIGIITAFVVSVFYGLTRLKTMGFKSTTVIIWGVLLIIVATFSAATYRRNEVWRDLLIMHSDIVKKSPLKARARVHLAIELFKRKRYNEALETFEYAVRLEPENSKTHNGLAVALSKMGRYEQALPHYYTALEINPANYDSYNNLGNTLILMGRFEDAIWYCREAIRLKPYLDMPHKNLGAALERMGRYEEAVQAYNEVIRLNPADTDIKKKLQALLGKIEKR